MYRYFKIFFIPFLFLSTTILNANKVDSLKNIVSQTNDPSLKTDIFNELFLIYEFTDTLKAKTYVLQALETAKNSDYKAGIIESYINLGYFSEDHADYINAIENYKISLAIAKTIGDNKKIAANHKNIGNVHLRQGEYPGAINHYQKALRIADEIDDEHLKSKCLANIGSIYLYQNNYERAIKNYKDAISISEKLGDINLSANCLNNLGLTYKLRGEYDLAIETFSKSLEILEKIHDVSGLADCYHNLGVVYGRDTDSLIIDYNKAIENFQKGYELYIEIDNKRGEALSLNSIGKLFSKNKDYLKGIEYSKRSLVIAKEIGSRDDIKNAYQNIALSYSNLENYKKAYEHLSLYATAKDSLNIEKSIQIQAELEAKYDNEKKQKEIELKNIEIAKKDAIVKQKTTFQYALIIVIALVIITAIIIYTSYRQKKKANILLSQQKMEIEEKNNDITNSIRYAKRIQESILPPDKLVKEYMPESFILYKPKDIVSGDFYWTDSQNGKTLFAVVDCTGHGVPGAFISIIGHNGLNRAVNEFGLSKPADILNKLNEIVNNTIKQSFEESTIRDGMDIALCSLDHKTLTLEYSGAHNPLYIVRDGEVLEYKPDKKPIGHFIGVNLGLFTNHEIKLHKNDHLYIFSDGYADQFGGPKNKKFKSINFRKLLVSISHHPIQNQKQLLEEKLISWMQNIEQIDDICIIGVKI